MYSITLEVNNKCNLKCRYCYLGEKKGLEMNEETGKKAIEIAIAEGRRHKDKKVNFDFIGGEALLNFKLLKILVEYIDKRVKEESLLVVYSMTSNAILFTEEILNFLAKYSFEMKVSLDGTKFVNDRNRIFYNDKGSYDFVVDKLELIRDYEKKTKDIVQVAHVITKNNFENFSESFEHLVDLGFKFIDTGFDYCTEWTIEEFKVIKEEIYKCYEIFIKKHKEKKPFMWKFIMDSFDNLKPMPFYGCGAGIISSYVTTRGELIPCPTYFKEEVHVGHVETGINKQKRRWLMNKKTIDNVRCNQCEIGKYCGAKSCLMMNLAVNNDIDKPVSILCWLEKFKYTFIREKYDEMLKVVRGEA